jgi:4-diphosphocytidyl-2-C-methyl-D-erythritol kinase
MRLTPPSALRLPFSLRTPAKINWFLKIVGKRDDGYHDIMSFMQCVNLYDELIFNHADTMDIEIDLDIPLHENTVYKAAYLIKKSTSSRKGAKIIVKKQIPVSAGLGGGSSDAACTLSGLNMLWGLHLSEKELSSVAAEIGSDIPFFFDGPSALVEGKGEKVSSLKMKVPLLLLLVKPPFAVSSAWAYASFDEINITELTKKPIDIKLFCQALNSRNFAILNNMLDNDLEEAVIGRYPVVRELKHGLMEMGAVTAAMSGSGPTVFGVFDRKDLAEKAAKVMKSNWYCLVETLV